MSPFFTVFSPWELPLEFLWKMLVLLVPAAFSLLCLPQIRRKFTPQLWESRCSSTLALPNDVIKLQTWFFETILWFKHSSSWYFSGFIIAARSFQCIYSHAPDATSHWFHTLIIKQMIIFQSYHEFSGQDLWWQRGAGQACHDGGSDPKAEGDWGHAYEETGEFLFSD